MREALAQAKRETAAAARDGILAHVEEAARARQEHAEAKRVTATAMDDMLQHLEQAARERAEHTEAKRQIADVKQQMLAEVLTQRTALRPAPPPPPPTFVTPEILLAGIEEAARALAEQAEAKRETAATKMM